MISKTLFQREWKANYKVLLIFVAIITMYATMIVAMYDPSLGESLTLMAKSMPEVFAAFGMDQNATTLIEFLGNYLYGFILIVIPVICTILLSHRLLARYLDRGSMAYLLATPHKRTQILTTQVLIQLLAMCLLVLYAMVLCIVTGTMMFDEVFPMKDFMILNIALLGLLFCLSSISFLFVCAGKDSRRAISTGSGMILLFILLQMLSSISDKFSYLNYLTPLSLFDVKGILAHETSAIWMFLVLYVIAALCYVVAIRIFKERDLSL